MADYSENFRRQSLRMRGYDYTQKGAYFVTICIKNRECLLGEITDGKSRLNLFGKIVQYHWQKIPVHFHHVKLDEFVFMPNHMHGILLFVDEGGKKNDNAASMHFNQTPLKLEENTSGNASTLPDKPPPCGTLPGSLSAVIQNFSSITTRKINRIRKTPGTGFWQRNYWDRIIRNETELNRCRKYIIENPSKWSLDKLYL